jgi:hypothetical protein
MILKFLYRNHREDIRVRTVTPLSIRWEEAVPDYKHDAGYYLHCLDLEKNEARSFDPARIIPQEGQLVLVDFTQMTDRMFFMSTIAEIRRLVDEIRMDDGMNSTKTVIAVASLTRMLNMFK